MQNILLICLGSKNNKTEIQPSTNQDPEISHSNEKLNNDNGNKLLTKL